MTQKTESLADQNISEPATEDESDSPTRTEIFSLTQTPQNFTNSKQRDEGGLMEFLTSFMPKGKSDTSLREAIEEAMENGEGSLSAANYAHEKTLISNVLDLQDMTVVDVMIPRVDIAALEVRSSFDEIYDVISKSQHSRYPVYRDNLDNIIGTVHIKDMMAALMHSSKERDKNEIFDLEKMCRSIPIISPAMPVLDLLLQMRETKKHMMLVVDEYGGIDGMVTIGDIVEDIVGNIDDEYDQNSTAQVITRPDGTLIVDARVYIDDFEEAYGEFLSEEEREENNTLAGVVFSMTGHVPARGEILSHPSGVEFEILDADLRRINRLKIRNLVPSSVNSQ